MKPFKTLLLCCLLAPVFVLSSCQPSLDEVTEKIALDRDLSQADYKVALEYTINAMNDLSDSIAAHRDDRAALLHSFMTMARQYDESTIIINKLLDTNRESLNEENKKLYDRAMKSFTDNSRTLSEFAAGRINSNREIVETDSAGGEEPMLND